jgi:acetyl esterase/lipase
MLAGYDWVVQHLAQGPTAVCGEFIGGSLASALALTECHQQKGGVRALVMGNPISDWTSMRPVPQKAAAAAAAVAEKTTTGSKRKRVAKASWDEYAMSALPASELLKARSTLFKAAEDYFDVFASPMLFFRTPSSSVPGEIAQVFLDPEVASSQAMKKRKSHRRYPPAELELRLPYTKVLVGEKNILKDQGIELAEGIARSNHTYGGPNGTGEGTGWERVEVDIKDGLGAWRESDLVEIGSSFAGLLRS